MMQLLLFLERDLFQDNFMMAHFILFFGFFNIVHSTSYMFSLNAFLLSFVLWLRLFALLTAQGWRMRLVCIRRVLFHYFCTFFCYLIFCCLTFLAPFIYPHPRNLPTTHNIQLHSELLDSSWGIFLYLTTTAQYKPILQASSSFCFFLG